MRGFRVTRARAAVVATVVSGAMMCAPALLQAQDIDSAPPPPGVSASLDSARAVRGAGLSVALYTYGPGSEVFERFGHVALVIRDSARGTDVAFNWGLFDFAQPHFLTNFLSGDTKYWMAGARAKDFNAYYISQDRSIRRQELALPPVERAALFDFVAWNATEAHKYYRYDYYEDNCATRIRDLLDRVLHGQIKTAFADAGGGRTWRGETARITETNLPVLAGIEVALGRRADHTLTRWEEAFLPEHLANHLNTLVLRDQFGGSYKLVSLDTVMATSTRVPIPTEPPVLLVPAALVGFTLAGLLAVLADAKGRGARAVLAVMVALWYGVGGVLGTLLLLAGTVTKHAPYMGANTTLLQLHPLLLVAAIAVTAALVRGARSRAAVGVSLTIALLALSGALVQLVPTLRQASGVVLAVTIPVHVALAIAVWRLERAQPSRRSSPGALARAA